MKWLLSTRSPLEELKTERGSVNIPNHTVNHWRTTLNLDGIRRLSKPWFFFAAAVLSLSSSFTLAQSTVSAGSIVGVVTDPAGVPIAGAKVEIASKTTGAKVRALTSSAGVYSSGFLRPGDYLLSIAAKDFTTARLDFVVLVGTTANGDFKMQAGTAESPVEVRGAGSVNLEQASIQGVLRGDQIENLPINGRDFIDLAQLEPDVQVQDGGTFDASKNGISSVSVVGKFGASARTVVDGVDINDEVVGGSTQNIPAGAILEFQVAQSMLDLSTGLTSSGGLNIATRSGGDQLHGELLGLFRGNQGAASLPGFPTPTFQREQFGGRAGGAMVKNKISGFASAERSTQNFIAAEPFTYPFDGLHATLSEPYREFNTDERLDWNVKENMRAFYRLNFFAESDLRPDSSASSTQQFRSTVNTETHSAGIDFHRWGYAHSIRAEYLKLRNKIDDATSVLGSVENPIPGLGINIGAGVGGNCVFSDGGSYCGGPSWLSPQQTVQSNKEVRYDGSRVLGEHVIRFGGVFNRIDGGRWVALGTSPQVGRTSAGTSPDPTSYAADWVSLGNGIGSSTAKSAFNFSGGGLGPDNRLELYVGDLWKITPKLTLTYGTRYLHDSGLTDTGPGTLPVLEQWGPAYGNRIRNPNLDFAPQIGFAWDANGTGKTVVRGGGGLFYENPWLNNLRFGSPRLSQGNFSDAPTVCQGGIADVFAWPTSLAGVASIAGGAAAVVNTPTGLQAKPTFCGQTISAAAPAILALSSAYRMAASGAGGPQPNSNFIGTTLTALSPNYALFDPNYRTPRSYQVNFGFQQEMRPGTILSVDYLRNIGERYLIAQDVNHSGAARSFNEANALAARDAAQVANGCVPGLAQVTCMIAKLGQAGAQAAYSAAGLDSNVQAVGGGPCTYCAFPGTTQLAGNRGAVGGLDMLFSQGHSVYSGLQMNLSQRIRNPVRGVRGANFQASYAYSKFVSQDLGQNPSAINLATDNDNPLRFTGPDGLDRRHQVSFGGTFDLPFSAKLSMIGRFLSPTAQNLELPELTNGGEIFATDWLGAGLGVDAPPEPLPGTKIGQFQRGATDIESLYKVITNYNHNYADNFTPAGACLVANSQPSSAPFSCPGLISGPAVFTPGDLRALGWVLPTLDSVGPHAVGIPWLKTLDLKASWPINLKDRVTIEPSASVFNVLNMANYFLPGNLPGASLIPGQNGVLAPNVVGGVIQGTSLTPFRANLGSGTFALGTPRQFQFGVRITF
jgi:hypothetical protein